MVHSGVKLSGVTLSPQTGALSSSVSDLNACLKPLAEELLPLLGLRLSLNLFRASGLFPVVLEPDQIKYILGRLLVLANDEIESSGMILLQTSRIEISGNGSSSSDDETAPQIVLTFRYRALEMDGIQPDGTAKFQSRHDPARFADAVDAVRRIVEESRGFLTVAYSYPETAITIHLPQLDGAVRMSQ